MTECCVAGTRFCDLAIEKLQIDIAAVTGNAPDTLIPVEVCRTQLAICRDGNVAGLFLDFEAASCDLAQLITPFSGLESFSAQYCYFPDQDLGDLAAALTELPNLHDVHLANSSFSGEEPLWGWVGAIVVALLA